jgi:hypothetical protein
MSPSAFHPSVRPNPDAISTIPAPQHRSGEILAEPTAQSMTALSASAPQPDAAGRGRWLVVGAAAAICVGGAAAFFAFRGPVEPPASPTKLAADSAAVPVAPSAAVTVAAPTVAPSASASEAPAASEAPSATAAASAATPVAHVPGPGPKPTTPPASTPPPSTTKSNPFGMKPK